MFRLTFLPYDLARLSGEPGLFLAQMHLGKILSMSVLGH